MSSDAAPDGVDAAEADADEDAAGDDPPEAFVRTCEELCRRIVEEGLERDDLEAEKREVCSEFSAPKVPTNGDVLKYAPEGRREEVKAVVRRKPVRTASGVSPVAIMTSPHLCPHGKCLYCPGGPASEFSSAQSYTGHEPAAARGKQNDYDPYGQVTLRLEQLRAIGHPVDKCELILMGGTMTARSHDYQEWFVKRALQAMNEYDLGSDPNPKEGVSFAQAPADHEFEYVEDVVARNETGDIRCTGITFETKPDWCDPEQIDRMLDLGGTKVEVGVQTTYERINREMHRGHGIQESVDANRRLRDAAFKVGFHMMPGQPGMTAEMCREDFRQLFADPKWRPDYLKIYPTLVVGGTRVYDMWRREDFEPLDNEQAADLVADAMNEIPKYCRLQRVQRDIPADFIEGGVWKSNLRQLAERRAEEKGYDLRDVRAREVGHNDENPDPDDVELDVLTYEAGGGLEHFISFEDPVRDLLVGFCRLRFPGDPARRELQNAALVRELHVYGSEATFDGKEKGNGEARSASGSRAAEPRGQWQHRGYGRRLIRRAEDLAGDAGFEKLSVISGIGVREYYRKKLGYHQDGPYVSKRL